LRIVEVNPLLLCLPAGVAVAASRRRQRLGDMLARTYVVRGVDLKALRNGLPPALTQQAATPVQLIAEQTNAGSLLARRWIGAWIDILVLLAMLVIPYSILGKEQFDAVGGWAGAAWLVAIVAYFVALEAIFGRTLGKLITGTVVVDRDGRPPGLAGAVTRTVLRLVEVNPLLMGGLPAGIAVLATERHQRLGDLLAETYVVRKKDLNRDDGRPATV
jgi:uncharacterized RDD family membrane protein YckC